MNVRRRQLRSLAAHRWWIVGGALLGFLAIGSSVGLMAMSAWLISRAAVVTNVADVALAVTAVRALAISRAAFRYLERVITHRATFRILSDMRVWVFGALVPLAPARLEGRRSGDLLSRIVADVDTMEDLYLRVLLPPLVAAMVTAFSALLLGAFDALLGAVLVGFLVLTGVVLPWSTRWLGRQASRDAITLRAEVHATVVDHVQGMADLMAFDQADRHQAAMLQQADRLDLAGERLALVRGLGLGLGALLTMSAGLTLLAMAIPLVTSGRLDGVLLAMVPLAAIASFEAVQPLSQSLQLLDATDTAAARLYELTDEPPAVIDPPQPAGQSPGWDLELSGVSFRYAPDLPPVLHDLDLAIPAGERVAVVGPSGAGKSSLIELLLRFRDPDAGVIRLGGSDVRACAQDATRERFMVVPQRIHLFDATVRDNLAVGRADATDEEMEAACRVAQVHDTVRALPDGYATRVGEHGVRLSGGERQRLAIARAILHDGAVVVLDEATANLDPETEAQVIDALLAWAGERTVIMVTHRDEVAARADRVVELVPHS